MVAYRFALDMFTHDGRTLGQFPITPDWEPALECAVFEGVRRGRVPAVTGAPTGSIEPVWDSEREAPYVAAFRALAPGADGVPVEMEIPATFLRAEARKAANALVEADELKSGDLFRYVTCAYPVSDATPAPAVNGTTAFAVEELAQPLPLEATPLERFLRRSVRSGEGVEAVLPVFIPRFVIDEAVALSREAKDVETGGILIGKLHRDETVPEVFAEVTAQIPAPHTVSRATKLTFTADTWAAVEAARTLRGQNELLLGWWHFHPDFCAKCPQENRRTCTLTSAFFSADDVHLHRACFARAYQVALLVSDSASTGMTTSLFGWHRGTVEARGFHLLQAT